MVYFVKTDDPAADWDAYCEELDRQAERVEVPLCEWCDKPLNWNGDDYFIREDSGEYVCMDCSEKRWKAKQYEWEKPRMRCIPYFDRDEEE